MKAALFYEHGGSEVIKIEQIEKPRISDDEVLIEVHWAALNRLDLFVRNGAPSLKIPLPHISGSDLVGEVVEVGSDVTNIEAGDIVTVNSAVFCGSCERCLQGEQSLCDSFYMIGEHTWGGLAEFCKVPARSVLKIPHSASCKEIAAGTLTSLTAWRMLSSKAKLRPGQTVLVVGAGGGLSTIAIQQAKILGAKVIAISSKNEETIRSLGADHYINYREVEDWSREVWSITGKRGVDVVFESVGEATWNQSLRSLRKGGILVTAGATTGFTGKVNIGLIFWKQLRIEGSTMANRAEFQEAISLLTSGHVKPLIDSEFSLDEVAKAMNRLEAPDRIGKVVIKVNGCSHSK